MNILYVILLIFGVTIVMIFIISSISMSNTQKNIEEKYGVKLGSDFVLGVFVGLEHQSFDANTKVAVIRTQGAMSAL